MEKITADYIPNLENMSDNCLYGQLSDIASYMVGNVNWKEYPYAPQVKFNVAFSDKALAILFKVTEDHVRGLCLDANGPVWEDSCVEIFIDNPKGEGYFNFETNCIGTALAAYRRSRTDADMFGAEHMTKIRTVGSLAHEAIDKRGENLEWSMMKVIPFEVLGLDSAPEFLKCNFYKCGDGCDQPHFLSWSPIDMPEPNFHCPEFFGEITLKQV